MKKSIGSILIRVVLVSLYALLVIKLVSFAMPDNIIFNPPIPKFLFIVLYFLFFNLNTEGSLFFDRYLNKRIPWFHFPKRRFFIQLGFIVLWAFVTIGIPFIVWYYVNGKSLAYPPASVIIFIGSFVFLFGIIGISMTVNFFRHWKESLLEAEHLKQEKLKADYRALQNQVNPHFLFNSLNVLISEIRNDPKKAENYTHKLSKVYRYVLQSKNQELISLQKELDFIHSYIYLHKVRVGEALTFLIDINKDAITKALPPLSLQLLVENAIKHNVVTEDEPLTICIKNLDEETLVVENNLNPKKTSESTNIGLENIKARYAILGTRKPEISIKNDKFIVTIPLLNN